MDIFCVQLLAFRYRHLMCTARCNYIALFCNPRKIESGRKKACIAAIRMCMYVCIYIYHLCDSLSYFTYTYFCSCITHFLIHHVYDSVSCLYDAPAHLPLPPLLSHLLPPPPQTHRRCQIRFIRTCGQKPSVRGRGKYSEKSENYSLVRLCTG